MHIFMIHGVDPLVEEAVNRDCFMNFPQINITDIEHQQAVREAARAARMAVINNLDQESREKLKKKEVQVYRRKNPKQPTADQQKPPPLEVLLSRTSKTGKVDLNFDFEGALSKMHVNVPLREAIKIPSIKERFDTFFSGSDEPMDPPIMLQADHFRVQYGEKPSLLRDFNNEQQIS
jgi:hypothetical protein